MLELQLASALNSDAQVLGPEEEVALRREAVTAIALLLLPHLAQFSAIARTPADPPLWREKRAARDAFAFAEAFVEVARGETEAEST